MKRYIFTVIYFLTSLTLIAQVGQSSGAPANVEAVDLGLPSGTRWANMNVGASSPEGCGDHFAWGETEPKDGEYSWQTYKWCSGDFASMTKYCTGTYGLKDDKTELDLEDDAAYINWEKKWRMPSKEQQDELREQCTWTWTYLNGVRGYRVTGPNGNSIFLPAAGERVTASPYSVGSLGFYWSRSLRSDRSNYAMSLNFSSGSTNLRSYEDRHEGESIRPVLNYAPPVARTFIDLGLPGGTKWANMNVGASRPEEYGKYFAWGETIEKGTYIWDNYMCPELTCGKSGDPVFDLVGDKADIAGTKFDAATMNWGDSWQMPTAKQIEELASNCYSSLVTINGVQCRKLKSRINGNEIVFPLAGARWYESFAYEGSLCYYWGSTLRQGGYVSPGRLIVEDDRHGWGWSIGGENDRFCAFPIRPIYVENNIAGDTLKLHKFSVAFEDDAESEMIGSAVTFQHKQNADSYSLSSDKQQEYDPNLDISKISSITRKSLGFFSLPKESGLTVNDITITVDGDTISTDDNGNYDAAGSTLVATNKDGEVVYMNIAAVEDANNATGADLNAKESAITLMLPLVPNIFVAFDDEHLPHLKEMIWDVDEVKQLAAAIDRSVAKYGYTDFGEISKEATAAKNKISQLLHLDKLAQKQTESASLASRKSMQMASGTKEPPYIVNTYGYGGLQVEITESEKKQFYHPYKITGYNCKVTAYNSNRFAYSSMVKGKYDAETNTYYIPDLGNDYDYYKNILKPQKVSTFMNSFTSFKYEDLERLGQFIEESADLLQGDIGFGDMHWDDMKKTANFDISDQDDAIILLFPRGNDYMMVYNILQSIIKPIVKVISKKAAKDCDSDIFVPLICGKLINDPNYLLEIKSTINDSDLSISEKIEKITSVTWTKFWEAVSKFVWDELDNSVKDNFTTFANETALKVGGREAASDWLNVKSAFKALGWVKKIGDLTTGTLGTFFEDNAVYPIFWEGNGQFVIEKDAVTVGEGESVNVRILVGNNSYSYSAESSDEEVASVSGACNKVKIRGIDAGDAVITIKDKVNQKTARIKVHVTGIQSFVLAEYEVSVPMYKDRSITIERGDGPFHIIGGDEKIAVAKMGGGNPWLFPGEKCAVVVSGISKGSTTFNIYDEATNQFLPLKVNITAEEETFTDERIVDLGLSVKWANCNVGANSPEEYGDYFAWGEVTPKDYYSSNNYKYYSNRNYLNIGSDISGTEYDAATHNMGNNWRMPTKSEYDELINKCEWKFVTYRKVRGWRITGPNGNSIFLPLAGYMLDDWNDYASIGGFYWSSNVTDTPREVHTLYTTMSDYKMSYRYMNRYEGRTIRAVTVAENVNTLKLSETSIAIQLKEQKTVNITSGSGQYSVKSNKTSVATASLSGTAITVKGVSKGSATITVTDTKTKQTATIAVTVTDGGNGYLSCPDGRHPHMIDLGLPDGTLWACCNVDATKPEEYGGYYAWGETETKASNYTDVRHTYDYDNYQHAYIDDNDKSGDWSWTTPHHYWHCKDLGDSICGTNYDVAYVKSEKMWHMPTVYNFEILKKYCSYENYTMNGIEGLLFVGKNGGSIFIPYTNTESNDGDYWTANPCPKDLPRIGTPSKNCSYSFHMYSSALSYVDKDDNRRYEGKSIRPVYDSHIPPLYLSTSKLNLTPGTHVAVDITCGSGSYDAVSNSTSVATVTVEGSKLNIKAVALGSASITVKDKQTQKMEIIEITVNNFLTCHDNYHPHLIDLGLPSGAKWACCNVGATKPEEYGDYFAWGETTPKEDYSWETYKWCDNVDNDLTKYCNDSNYGYNGFTDTKTELDLEDDAAYVNWGGDWRMPSWEQQKELLDNCTSELMQLNGVYGRKVTGPNGNSIFLPMASWYWRTELESANYDGRYWSRSLYRYPIYASYLQLQVDWEYFGGSDFTRCFGYSVRPVKEKK